MATKDWQGVVVKRSGDKTVAIEMAHVFVHSLYRKRISQTRRFLAHDPGNTAQVGQTVTIRSIRPHSRLKRWIIVSK